MSDSSTSSLSPDEQDKLRELTTQSWNLELAISGVAMFAILQLPDLLESAFSYLQHNFLLNDEGMPRLLISLSYSMIRAIFYVLFAAFLANFVMRAFWVGLVGLLAVYPSGIHYDRIPYSTPYSQRRMADELGPLDRYILRLDKRCNIVFALAFQFVFFLIVVGMLYVFGLVIYLVVQPNVSPAVWLGVKIGIGLLVAGFYIALIVLSLKKVREHPRGMKLQYQLTKAPRLMLMGMYRPSSYITNTFYSHIPKQRFTRTAAIFMTVFMVVFLVEYTIDQARNNPRSSAFSSRHLYSARVDSLFLDPGAYDNQRPEGELVGVASIQADVIREPYIRLFIAYPKALDTLLTRLAPEPSWPDSLSRTERRRQQGVWINQQINRLVRLTVNDSTIHQPDLLFAQAGPMQQRGWQTVLVPGNLVKGRNLLRVGIQRPGQSGPDELAAIPFWYVPEP
ncbi:hypothetical protein FAES_2997 [Fibrella aestuarina BUZ 2]|uniref:Uncharacterized protein n=1 Tax=Fibrella aestuarina BUZ 2 TaxID=1166018 RepID=I0KA53_9BACT|nr:hypothetical protein [Fibrella aestuarina]CCH01006.1 hypothetical protein FAES_2997 [Fibrella aestuarina BUZ 2]